MLISDRPFALALFAAIFLGGAQAYAFELKTDDPQAVSRTPSSALPALPEITPTLSSPSLAAPSLPDLGVNKGVRDMWRRFVSTYKSGDKEAAIKQLEAAALQGDVLAQWKLARMYADGDGVTQDDYKAFRTFLSIADKRADESPDSFHASVVADSFVALGLYWLEGIPQSPVKANLPQAYKAFNQAATLYAHPEAQFQLARMLMDGALGKPDRRLALRWFYLAAEKGHVQAQAMLGRTLLTGEGGQKPSWRGLMWLQVAKENAVPARDGWVLDMHRHAFEAASEDDRKTAQIYAERFLKAQDRR